MSVLSNYSSITGGGGDWRQQLRRNEHRTYAVMAVFILIYACIGLIIDLYLNPVLDQLPITQAIYILLTFKIIPIASLSLSGIAVISILITYALHDRIMLLGTDYHEVTLNKQNNSLEEQQLYNTVEELKIAASLRYMPKIYIIEADYMNAFASGYSEKSALVAITRGLLNKLERSELQAVMAHELSHIRHHDIKLTLMASVLSNIMIIAVDIIFKYIIFTNGGRSNNNKNRGNNSGGIATIIILLRFLLPIITVLLLLYLSRKREFMADAGSVELIRDNTPLAKALIKINDDHTENKEKYSVSYGSTAHEEIRCAAYIFDPKQAGISTHQAINSLFSTHPSLAERLQALGFKPK
jgi:heat shock protein HtpX